MIFQHHRFQIWNQSQHPFRHSLSDFAYASNGLPGVTNVQTALDYILAVLYPTTQPNVATVGALPGAGNTIGDFRIVDDDGDGKSAGYRWEQREGDVSASWYKVFDVDWSTDAILAAVTDVTQDLYFIKMGRQDLDENGDIITGLYAGQSVWGGTQANQNLTLNANSGDGTGAQTGFVQTDSNFRPAIDNTYDLSTATERWKDAYFSGSIVANTVTIATGSITDSTGSLSFGNENVTTTGTFSAGTITGTSLVADNLTNSATIAPGTYTDTSGAVSFGSSNLTTTGTLDASTLTLTESTETLLLDPNVGGSEAQITSSLGAINFVDENLITTGTFGSGTITCTQLNADNLRLDGNTLSSEDVNGNIILSPNGTGVVQLLKEMQTAFPITSTSNISATGSVSGGNLRMSVNTFSSTNTDGNITFDPNGTGVSEFASNILPTVDNSFSLGTAALRYTDLFLSSGVGDGTNSIGISTLLSFRNGVWRDAAQTTAAVDGDALFYNAASGTWLASVPDSEVAHADTNGVATGDAGHTQFVMLAGRAGGQALQGGTAASENLDLESTSNVTKGLVRTKDDLVPFTNASFSGTWSGTDLGGASNYFKDVYTKGEFRGFRLENFTSGTLPSASSQNVGRTVYSTDNNKAYVDTGTQFKVLGVSKFVADTAWNGVITSLDTDVSAEIEDARNAQWQLRDNANDFEIMGVTIKATTASNVRIEVAVPLASGSYRLIGIE